MHDLGDHRTQIGIARLGRLAHAAGTGCRCRLRRAKHTSEVGVRDRCEIYGGMKDAASFSELC